MTLIETRRKQAKQVDYGIVLATGFSMLLFVILSWRSDSQTTMLTLFMMGLFYPLAVSFVLALTFLSFRAIRSKDLKLTCLNGLSILYIALWIIALQWPQFSYNEFRTSFIFIASLIYAIIFIALGLGTLGRIYIEDHSG